MMQYDENGQYTKIKQQAMMQRANHYRMMQGARAGRKRLAFRFYDAALAQVGRWMVLSGNHLQRRYGQIAELSQPPQKPIRAKVSGGDC